MRLVLVYRVVLVSNPIWAYIGFARLCFIGLQTMFLVLPATYTHAVFQGKISFGIFKFHNPSFAILLFIVQNFVPRWLQFH